VANLSQERRSCIADQCAIHEYSSGQDHLPDHHQCRPKRADIRFASWPPARLPQSTTVSSEHHSHPCLPGQDLCGVGRNQWRAGRCVDIQAWTPACRAGAGHYSPTAPPGSGIGQVDCSMWPESTRDMEERYIRALHDDTGTLDFLKSPKQRFYRQDLLSAHLS
jgi:hypothetical protein